LRILLSVNEMLQVCNAMRKSSVFSAHNAKRMKMVLTLFQSGNIIKLSTLVEEVTMAAKKKAPAKKAAAKKPAAKKKTAKKK